jgi:glucans biosynthesis protein C
LGAKDSKRNAYANKAMTQTPKPRLFFIDNLRTVLIVLVILQHSAITYGAITGSWYIHEGLVDLPLGFVYVFFLAANQAFFMGLLFLFAGYFTAPSYDRKGPGLFTADRALRLALPIPFFIFLIGPITKYALNGFQGNLLNLFSSSPFEVNVGFGPLWFILALFFFSVAYLVWRVVRPNPTKLRGIPSNRTILVLGLLLSAATFAVRLAFPIGVSSVFDVLSFQIAFFPQYIAFFIVGLLAFRGNWIMTVPKETGRLWGKVAIALLLLMPALFIGGSIGFVGLGPFGGGWTLQAVAFAFWEQFLGVAVSIALMVWFREKVNLQTRFTKALAENSYAAYILQTPILVYLAVLLQSVQMPLLLKFAVVSPFAVALCFLVGFFVRKIPKVDNVL